VCVCVVCACLCKGCDCAQAHWEVAWKLAGVAPTTWKGEKMLLQPGLLVFICGG
jgi:hypothetical protein